jgi:hypothetical protein
LRIAAHTDSGIHVSGQFGTAEKEGIDIGVVIQDDFGDNALFEDDIQPCIFELLFKAEDFIEDAGFLRISLLKAES